jgi:hypothetical protein
MSTIWKSVAVSLSLVAEVLRFSDSASADWQGTEWGMCQ